MKILTISIAAYNVEKYLRETLDSLCDYRYIEDLEVLVIDDGSKDSTGVIAEEYANRYPNSVIYIKKENGGHGSTINRGIMEATGKYFRIIDGDDWVDNDSFYEYMCKLKSVDDDIILTQHKSISTNAEHLNDLVHGLKPDETYSLDKELGIELVTLHMLTVRTELLKVNNVRITEKCFYVDVEYVIWALYLASTIRYMELPVYMYRVGSITQSVNKTNMVKNIGMQETVSKKLLLLYDTFSKNVTLSNNKNEMIFARVNKSVATLMRTYLLLDRKENIKGKIRGFDNVIKSTSEGFYQRTKTEWFFIFLRFGNYMLVPAIRTLYKIWCLRYD